MVDPEDTEQEQASKESVAESLAWVVNMMNSGRVRSEDVYPSGRYQGD